MTREDFMANYGDAIVTFESYYKYTFTYTGFYANCKVSVDVGGDADEIYRMDVGSRPVLVRDLFPYSGAVTKEGELVDEFYDF